jgi:hypothetical protein
MLPEFVPGVIARLLNWPKTRLWLSDMGAVGVQALVESPYIEKLERLSEAAEALAGAAAGGAADFLPTTTASGH